MNFITSFKTCVSKYATFTGRARRSEYWWFCLANFILGCIPVINYISGLALLLPGLAVAVRRLHDINKSGWWVLLALIPLVNLYLIYLYCQDSQPGDNQYGACPKA